MGAPRVISVVDEGLGNSAYLVDLGDGRALAVDASRDVRALRETASGARLSVAFAADTHLHADFLSGAVQLAATDGATVLASAAGGRDFPHRGLRDEDEVDLGGVRLRTLATPGHTTEHVAFVLMDGDRPVGVFTGGSLIVGSAARTDLVDPTRTVELARAQFASIQRLLALPDETAVWPTHGAGSFCSAPPGAQRVSTIGRERATNALLVGADEDAFVARLVAGLGSYPPYFTRLGPANRVGPTVVAQDPPLPPLDVVAVRSLLARGGQLVDVRPVVAFAAGHLPGAVSIPLRPAFATWLGWLTDPDRPIVIVRDADQDPAEITWQALKIGYENLAGELTGGVDMWRSAGQPLSVVPLVDAAHCRTGTASTVLDIRQRNEFAAGHLPGAVHLELGDLAAAERAAMATAGPDRRIPAGPLIVMCGHGERAMGAASLLHRAGRHDVSVLTEGPGDWAEATKTALDTGP